MNEQVTSAANRIKEALHLRGMKQIELSEKSGINRPSISCYISGKYEPKQEALYKMGRALDVSEMWLAGYDVPMERPAFQKENDEFVDLIELLRQKKEFRSLVIQLSKLNPDKLESLMNLLDVHSDKNS